MNKPKIMYVDDEARNLTIFEALLDEEYEVVCFSDPVLALNALKRVDPVVVLSDQRMPGVTGVDLLTKALEDIPDAVRMIVTGYSEEDLVVDSVQEAKIYDYIRKPWDAEDLEHRIKKAIQHYNLEKSKKHLTSELKKWIHPFVFSSLEKNIKYPIKRDLIGVVFDIFDSSTVYGHTLDGENARKKIKDLFLKEVISNGGWAETFAGDSVYCVFGLDEDLSTKNHAKSAYRVVQNFYNAISGIKSDSGLEIKCGIAIDLMPDVEIFLSSVEFNGIVQNRFETVSPHIDVLHRIESLSHSLNNTSVISSQSFANILGIQGCIKLTDFSYSHSISKEIILLPGLHESNAADINKFRERKLRDVA